MNRSIAELLFAVGFVAGARSGQHDDLVLAVAIGAWWASRPEPTVTFGSFD